MKTLQAFCSCPAALCIRFLRFMRPVSCVSCAHTSGRIQGTASQELMAAARECVPCRPRTSDTAPSLRSRLDPLWPGRRAAPPNSHTTSATSRARVRRSARTRAERCDARRQNRPARCRAALHPRKPSRRRGTVARRLRTPRLAVVVGRRKNINAR